MTETLSQISVFFLFGAMALYAAAFVAFALDLAHRAGQAGAAVAVPSAVERRAEVASGAGAAASGASSSSVAASGRGATATLSRLTTRVEEGVQRVGTSRSLRVGYGLTLFAFALHIVADVLRGVAAGRVPWANMYEFSMTGSLFIVAVFLIVNLRYDLRFLGSFVTGLILILLGISTVRYYVAVVPLPPALQSYWLVIHVLVATIATGFFALGFALSAAQLARGWRDGRVAKGKRGVLAFLTTLPSATTLENLAYRVNIVGFILWTFTLMAGSIWAEKAWGRYWGWDTKEVWTFIIWVIYAGYIHARATRGWRGSRSAWLAVIGFAAVLFNFGIVNVFFHGLHAYSGL